jgi:hypothetical protein
MKIKGFTSALCLAMLLGCNTGDRDSNKAHFGPGSGPAPAQGGTTGGGTTGGGATPGSGGGATAGTFNPGPAMTTARASHTATVMNDGRVLVVGGTDGQGLLPTSEVFDPVASSWTDTTQLAANPNDGVMLDPTGQFATVRQDHTANNLGTGLVLIAGGFGAERLDAQGQPVGEMLKTCYLFNPQSNSYQAAADLTENRGWHVSALLANGDVIVMAGLDQNFSLTLTNAEVFDGMNGTWSQISPGTASHHTLGNAITSVNQTLVVGGVNLSAGSQGLSIAGFASPAVEIFNQQSGSFQGGPTNVGERMEMGAQSMSVGNAFFAGGRGLDASQQNLIVVDTTEVYDPTAQAFNTGPTLGVARAAPEVAEIGTTSDMLITGGIDGSGVPTAVCEVYGVLNNVILGTVNMSTERVDHTAVTLQNGQILVAGGNDANGTPVDSTEIHTR